MENKAIYIKNVYQDGLFKSFEKKNDYNNEPRKVYPTYY